jgi:hypothetical protein
MGKNDGSSKFEKGGYRPLNEGYSPKEQTRGYAPTQGNHLPKPPKGGTGESPKPASSTPTGGWTKVGLHSPLKKK